MGTLRFIFTITIILGHIYSIFGFRYHELLSSPIAFESFFLLSGFYMAMVWQNDYSLLDGGLKKFWIKRALRIFPLYWIILGVSIVASLVTFATMHNALLLQPAFAHWSQMQWYVRGYILFSNIFIFGQEAIYFLKINFSTGAFAWSRKFIDGDPPLHLFLLISQAWAISYILYFYLLLPLLSRLSTLIIILLAGLSLGLRFWWYHTGHQNEPWLYRFFPFELAFFLAGMVSFRIYSQLKDKMQKIRPAGIILFLVFIVVTCSYDSWMVDYLTKQWLYYALFWVLTPLFFSISRHSKVDNYLGQLAYPAYISNFIIIYLLRLLHISDPIILVFAVLGTTLFVSMLLLKFVVDPINSYALARVGVLKRPL